MSSTTNAGGKPGMSDVVGRLSTMSNRTNLMVIDATFRALPKDDANFAEAAAEVRALARRMQQAAQDFQATVKEPQAAPAE